MLQMSMSSFVVAMYVIVRFGMIVMIVIGSVGTIDVYVGMDSPMILHRSLADKVLVGGDVLWNGLYSCIIVPDCCLGGC